MNEFEHQIKIIRKECISYIKKHQRKDGSFVSYSSAHKEFNSTTSLKTYATTFLNSFMLYFLADIEGAEPITKTIATFLLNEQQTDGSWNYWAKNTKEYISKPYPNDLDDTACALSALNTFNPYLCTGEQLSKFIQLLTSAETQPGGPYTTWLVPHDAPHKWRDVDLAVQANIGFMLSLLDIELESITCFIENAIGTSHVTSPYYPSDLPILFFISRWYKGKHITKLIQKVTEQLKQYKSHSAFDIGLLVVAALNTGTTPQKIKKYISHILHLYNNKKWTASAFCLDPEIDKVTNYAGAECLTMACCLYALNLYTEKTEEEIQKRYQVKKNRQNQKLAQQILQNSFNRASASATEIDLLEKVTQSVPKHEIPLLSYFTYTSLHPNIQKMIPQRIYKDLGVANILGWTAYKIYDDILDSQKNVQFLTFANRCSQELEQMFIPILSPYKSNYLYTDTIKTIEKANEWEQTHTRLPILKKNKKTGITINISNLHLYDNHQTLHQKSWGHALGPLTLLITADIKPSSKEYNYFMKFFEHYLVAKQLNDDAHDWYEDLEQGIQNPANTLVLKVWQEIILEKSHSQKDKPKDLISINITQEKETLETLFWEQCIHTIAKDILSNCHSALKYLDQLKEAKILSNTTYLVSLIEAQQKSATKALDESKKMIAFLNAYKTNEK